MNNFEFKKNSDKLRVAENILPVNQTKNYLIHQISGLLISLQFKNSWYIKLKKFEDNNLIFKD